MTLLALKASDDDDCDDIGRVAKCHRYGRYICVKNCKVGVKSVGLHAVLQNEVIWE